MAAPMLKLGTSILDNFYRVTAPCTTLIPVRGAKKIGGGQAKNKRGNTPGKRRGWKRNDGVWVHKREILVRQLGLRYWPGENVGLGRDGSLFALKSGHVMVTTEKLSPFPRSPLYHYTQKGIVIYKKFFHVIETDQVDGVEYKLVSQI